MGVRTNRSRNHYKTKEIMKHYDEDDYIGKGGLEVIAGFGLIAAVIAIMVILITR